MNEEFDTESCTEAMKEETEWQMKEWERERLKDYTAEIKNLMETLDEVNQ